LEKDLAIALLIEVKKELFVYGSCRILSINAGKVDSCHCPLCQIEAMDIDRLLGKAKINVTKL
jgi:hypothetical protein